MNIWQEYHIAHEVSDALVALETAPGPACLIAGGTDLLLDLQQGRHPPVHTLVDISEITELNTLEVRQESLFIGAAVPLNQVAAAPEVNEHVQALAEAAGLIGGPQVRNTATLGGNVGHALPAGDGTIALVACDALVEIARRDGRRKAPLLQLFRGPGKSTLDPKGEIIVGFHLPLLGNHQGSAFQRVMRPQGVAIAILNMAINLKRAGDKIADVRVAVGPAGRTPYRGRPVEDVLRGKTLDDDTISTALEVLLQDASLRTSRHRATLAYRQAVAGVLLRDVLNKAWERSE